MKDWEKEFDKKWMLLLIEDNVFSGIKDFIRTLLSQQAESLRLEERGSSFATDCGGQCDVCEKEGYNEAKRDLDRKIDKLPNV